MRVTGAATRTRDPMAAAALDLMDALRDVLDMRATVLRFAGTPLEIRAREARNRAEAHYAEVRERLNGVTPHIIAGLVPEEELHV